MRIFKLSVFMLVFVFLAGCATEKNIPLADNYWASKKHKVAVATVKAPTPQLYKAGDQGLLDMAISSTMTNGLDTNLSHIDLDWYRKLPTNFVAQLKQRHIFAKSSEEQLNGDEKSYLSFASKVGSDELLVLSLDAVGAKREYSGFIPMGAPQGYCVMTGELINTKNNNQVLWHYRANISEPVKGEWDQPPNYQNVNNAVQVAINSAKNEVIDSFFSGH